jgi:phytoene synthase
MTTEPEPVTAASEADEVEAHLQRRDPDRWLSARLIADLAARRDVLALYAFEDAIRSVAGAVSNPMMGEIRLAWWGEAVEEIAADRPARAHPVLQALDAPLRSGRLKAEPLLALIAARHADLDPEPFADAAALERFLQGAYAAPMQAAAGLLDPAAEGVSLTQVGRAWGLASLLRETPHWSAEGRRWRPPEWGDDPAAQVAQARARLREALRTAGPELRALPVAAFPAVAHAALSHSYAAGREPNALHKRLRVLWASLRGRV